MPKSEASAIIPKLSASTAISSTISPSTRASLLQATYNGIDSCLLPAGITPGTTTFDYIIGDTTAYNVVLDLA
jgi:hypothetical protein